MHNNADSLSFQCVQDANAIELKEKLGKFYMKKLFVCVRRISAQKSCDFEIAKVTFGRKRHEEGEVNKPAAQIMK